MVSNYPYMDLMTSDTTLFEWILTDGTVTASAGGCTVSGQTYALTNESFTEDGIRLSQLISDTPDIEYIGCAASRLSFTARVSDTLINKPINAYVYIRGIPESLIAVGRFKCVSDELTANTNEHEIEAYDVMSDYLNIDVADWYNSLLPNSNSTVTLKTFRQSLFSHLHIDYADDVLCNDAMMVGRTIEPETLSSGDVLKYICQINGRFGRIRRDGKFEFKKLITADAPRLTFPSVTLYPGMDVFPAATEPDRPLNKSEYIDYPTVEQYRVKKITSVTVRETDEDVGGTYGTPGNSYAITGNILAFGKSPSELQQLTSNLLSEIGNITYIPMSIVALGNPALEAGDTISFETDAGPIVSIILERELYGCATLTDEYSAKGNESRTTSVTFNTQFKQLKSKTFKMSIDVDGLKGVIGDSERGLIHDILITAGELASEITRATAAEGILTSKIAQSESEISLKVTKTELVGDLDAQMGSGIEIGVDRIAFKSSGSITIDTENFKLDTDGNATFSGNIVGGSIRGASFFSEGVYQPDPSITTGGIPTSISIEGGVLHNEWTIDTGITGSIDMWPGQIFLSLNSHGSTQSTRVGYDSISSTAGSFDRMYLYHGGSYHLVDFILLSEYTGQEKVLCIRPF